jgi:hypothetical protein
MAGLLCLIIISIILAYILYMAFNQINELMLQYVFYSIKCNFQIAKH